MKVERDSRPMFWLAAVLPLTMAASMALAAEPPAPQPLADHVLAATVGITARTDDGGSFTGTGSVITPAGHILTSTSVVPPDATEIEVMFPGFVPRSATLLASDPGLAASLIKVEAENLAALPLAREPPPVGGIAYTAGDVDRVLLTNGRASFSRGIVSGRYSVARQGETAYAGGVIETTAAVNPGSDGGPLVDAGGRLCGVISLGVSPLRWQGVAVPTAVLLDRFPPLASAELPLRFEPPSGLAADGASRAAAKKVADLGRAASLLTPAIVGIEVRREHPPEALPRISWSEHRRTIANWNELSKQQRAERFAAFAAAARTLEVNQLLRRPAGRVTGLVISSEGHLLTSLFNIGTDTAFLAKATGRPRAFDPGEPLEKLIADPPGGLDRTANAITGITAVLADGSRHEAEVVARHEPLGVALLKIDAADLDWFDITAAGSSPLLGDAVAVVGWGPDEVGTTLNAGIVSAASRMRGYQFQTDALLNYGNSGGPVIDAAGNFLGIATAPIEPDTVLGKLFNRPQLMRWTRAPNSGVGMVARADRIAAAMEMLKEGRSFDRIPGPFLGVQADMSRAFGEDVVIGGVAAGSPAERAGLRKGDRLLEFGGVELHTWRELTERVAASSAGDTVTLLVQRPSRGPRLVIAGRDIDSLDDLNRLKRSLRPGDTFEGILTTDDTREVAIVLEENR